MYYVQGGRTYVGGRVRAGRRTCGETYVRGHVREGRHTYEKTYVRDLREKKERHVIEIEIESM